MSRHGRQIDLFFYHRDESGHLPAAFRGRLFGAIPFYGLHPSGDSTHTQGESFGTGDEMAPSSEEVAAAEAALRHQTLKAPRVDPNHAHRPPTAPPLLACSKEEADEVIAQVLARLDS